MKMVLVIAGLMVAAPGLAHAATAEVTTSGKYGWLVPDPSRNCQIRGVSLVLAVLVPTTFTLRELHGVIQVAMGWEGSQLGVTAPSRTS